MYIVTEYCNKRDLERTIKGLKEQKYKYISIEKLWPIFVSVVLGLYVLHSQNILHRDVKAANIFYHKDNKTNKASIKIGDLGVAKLLDKDNMLARTLVGTVQYFSPEICDGKPYNHKTDVWALGMLLYQCCTLSLPFENIKNPYRVMMKILQGNIKPIDDDNGAIPSILIALIQSCLIPDMNERPSIKDLLHIREFQEQAISRGFDLPDDIQLASIHKNPVISYEYPPWFYQACENTGIAIESLHSTKAVRRRRNSTQNSKREKQTTKKQASKRSEEEENGQKNIEETRHRTQQNSNKNSDFNNFSQAPLSPSPLKLDPTFQKEESKQFNNNEQQELLQHSRNHQHANMKSQLLIPEKEVDIINNHEEIKSSSNKSSIEEKIELLEETKQPNTIIDSKQSFIRNSLSLSDGSRKQVTFEKDEFDYQVIAKESKYQNKDNTSSQKYRNLSSSGVSRDASLNSWIPQENNNSTDTANTNELSYTDDSQLTSSSYHQSNNSKLSSSTDKSSLSTTSSSSYIKPSSSLDKIITNDTPTKFHYEKLISETKKNIRIYEEALEKYENKLKYHVVSRERVDALKDVISSKNACGTDFDRIMTQSCKQNDEGCIEIVTRCLLNIFSYEYKLEKSKKKLERLILESTHK